MLVLFTDTPPALCSIPEVTPGPSSNPLLLPRSVAYKYHRSLPISFPHLFPPLPQFRSLSPSTK